MEDAIVSFVTTGKASFKDFARSILADMARIYARQLMLGIFGPLLPAAPISASDVTSALNSPGMAGAMDIEAGRDRNALGNIYGRNGIVPFAQGGVVDRPTIFPFANGTGLMGEAGPEAIMPLTRGPDGKLGVEALGRYTRSGGSSSSAGGGGDVDSEGGSIGDGGIDVRFTSERINSVDYVTFEQFQAGVQEAARQGAQQGKAATLRQLQTSPSTRRRVGV